MKIALIQFAVSSNKERNLERVCTFIKEAAQNGAKLVCLPVSRSTFFMGYFQNYTGI